MIRYTNNDRFSKFSDVKMVGSFAEIPSNVEVSKIFIEPNRRLSAPLCSVNATNKLLTSLGLGPMWRLSCSPITVDSITINTYSYDGRGVDGVAFEVETLQLADKVLKLLNLEEQHVNFVAISKTVE